VEQAFAELRKESLATAVEDPRMLARSRKQLVEKASGPVPSVGLGAARPDEPQSMEKSKKPARVRPPASNFQQKEIAC
jgi:hypothetical protein